MCIHALPNLHGTFWYFSQCCDRGLSVIFEVFLCEIWNWTKREAARKSIKWVNPLKRWWCRMLKLLSQESECQKYRIQIEFSVGPVSLLQKWIVSISAQWCVKNDGISLTGKEAIKTFYFSTDLEVKPATEQNYFCLQKSLHSHTPTIDHNWDYHIKYLQIWFHYEVSWMKEQSKFSWIKQLRCMFDANSLTGVVMSVRHCTTASERFLM